MEPSEITRKVIVDETDGYAKLEGRIEDLVLDNHVVPVVVIGKGLPRNDKLRERLDGDMNVDDKTTEGFYGLSGKNPGPIYYNEEEVVTSAGGASTDVLAAAPGAAYRHRILGLRFKGADLSGGNCTINGTHVFRTKFANHGTNETPVNELLAANTAITSVITAGGNTVTYVVGVRYRTEDA